MSINMALAVISGASKGIGKALAQAFAAEGFNIAINARGKEALNALSGGLREQYPGIEVLALPVDMSVKDEVINFCKEVESKIGSPDVVINNAGVFLPGEILAEEDGSLEKMIDTNLYSSYYMTRGFSSSMIERGSGHIFNINSIAALKAYPGGSSYCISKAAQLAFSRSLREEMKAHQIRVTAILPGATFTDSWDGVDLPEERFMPAEDIAQSVVDCYKMSDRTVVEEIILRPFEGDL